MDETQSWLRFLKAFGIRVKPPTAYTCSRCGRRYRRRNQVEAWTKTAHGQWVKRTTRVCTTCASF